MLRTTHSCAPRHHQVWHSAVDNAEQGTKGMWRRSTRGGQGPIGTSVSRPDISRPDRAIRKHGGDLRRGKWTRRYDRTRIGRRGGGSRREWRTDARQRYIRPSFLYRTLATGSPAPYTPYCTSESTRSNTAVVPIARKLRLRAFSFIVSPSHTHHRSAAPVTASRPRTSTLPSCPAHRPDRITLV
jgi:hypothetical protein